jgi:hypothetical protein
MKRTGWGPSAVLIRSPGLRVSIGCSPVGVAIRVPARKQTTLTVE